MTRDGSHGRGAVAAEGEWCRGFVKSIVSSALPLPVAAAAAAAALASAVGAPSRGVCQDRCCCCCCCCRGSPAADELELARVAAPPPEGRRRCWRSGLSVIAGKGEGAGGRSSGLSAMTKKGECAAAAMLLLPPGLPLLGRRSSGLSVIAG